MNYVVYSPDNIPIQPRSFKTSQLARVALKEWCARFAPQGYYRDAAGRRIALADLPNLCRIEEI